MRPGHPERRPRPWRSGSTERTTGRTACCRSPGRRWIWGNTQVRGSDLRSAAAVPPFTPQAHNMVAVGEGGTPRMGEVAPGPQGVPAARNHPGGGLCSLQPTKSGSTCSRAVAPETPQSALPARPAALCLPTRGRKRPSPISGGQRFGESSPSLGADPRRCTPAPQEVPWKPPVLSDPPQVPPSSSEGPGEPLELLTRGCPWGPAPCAGGRPHCPAGGRPPPGPAGHPARPSRRPRA